MEIESTDGSKDEKNLGPNNKCLKLDNVEADWYYKVISSSLSMQKCSITC